MGSNLVLLEPLMMHAEIRNGDIDREEGKLLVKKYDHEFPKRFM